MYHLKLGCKQNEVVSLAPGLDVLRLAGLQGGVNSQCTSRSTIWTIQGTDYVYHENGQRLMVPTGYYARTSTSDQILGQQILTG
jgi:hypothetical protein